MRFRHAHGVHPDWSIATEECLLLLSRYAGDERYVRNANLGFLYLTDALAQHAEQILATLKARTGVANWVGCTGVGICATGVECYEEPALAVLLGQFPAGSVNVFSGRQRPPAVGTRTDAGADAAYTALVHADPHTPDLPELLQDMGRKVSSGYLFGGVASGRQRALMIADRVLAGGLSGVVFADDVHVVSRVTQGVHPLPAARRRRVTRAIDNLIIELDGRRAFDVLLEDAGIGERAALRAGGGAEAARIRARLQALGRQGLFVGIEPQTTDGYRERAHALRADYVARHVVALDPGRGVVAVGAPVYEGMTLRFCTRDEAAARKDLIRICAEIREHLHERREAGVTAEAKGAIYVSCLGRSSHLFGEVGEELRLIRTHLGEVPLVGFYAGGEIGGTNLYGFTGVLTVFY